MLQFVKFSVLVSLSVLIILASHTPQSAPFASDLTLQNMLEALGGIFAITLLVERTTEIFINFLQQQDTSKDNDAEKAINPKKFKSNTQQIAFLIGFSISVIICSSGVGLLGEIIDIPEDNQGWLRGIDIVLK